MRVRPIHLGMALLGALAAGWGATAFYLHHSLAIDRMVVNRYSSAAALPADAIKEGPLRRAPHIRDAILSINCRFRLQRPAGLAPDGVLYANLFQTGAVNSGVRLECAVTRADSAPWALILAKKGGGITPIPLSPPLRYGSWHRLEIEVKAERVRVWFDGHIVNDGTWPMLDYVTDEVMVGAAFSGARPFCGDISDFIIQTRYYAPAVERWSNLFRDLFFIGLAVLLLLRFYLRPAPGPSKWLALNEWLRPNRADDPAPPQLVWGKLRLLLVIVAFGNLFAAIYYYCNAVYWCRPYPYNSYLNIPSVRFTDYDNMILMCRNLNPYHDLSRSGYPPFANLLYYPFRSFSMNFGYFLFLIPPTCFLVWAARRVLQGQDKLHLVLAVVFLLLFSYPFIFTFDRGNLEFYIMIALGTFFLFYNAKEGWKRDLACVGLAAGIALKIYPAVLLLLPLKDRRWLDLVKIGLLAELLTVVAAMSFVGGPVVALHDFAGMLSATNQVVQERLQYAHGNAGIYYSVIIVLKELGCNVAIQWFDGRYWLIALAVLGCYALIIARTRMSFWASSVCLVTLMCLVPSLSNDYRTIQMLIPMLLFAAARTRPARGYLITTVLFGLLLVPRNYWIMFPDVPAGDIGIGSVITPAVLLLLLNLILIEERFGGTNRGQAIGPGPSVAA